MDTPATRADVLLGRAEPGGRLPVTIPAAEADSPVPHATPTATGVLSYPEGLLIGYRDAADWLPRYAFGHGLGYTTWECDSVDCPAWLSEGSDLELTVRVRNTGSRPSTDVVQVYQAEPGDPARSGPAWTTPAAGLPLPDDLVAAEPDARHDGRPAGDLRRTERIAEQHDPDRRAEQRLQVQERARDVGRDPALSEREERGRQHRASQHQPGGREHGRRTARHQRNRSARERSRQHP